MTKHYTITYNYTNSIKQPIQRAAWLFLITPECNSSQRLISSHFKTNINTVLEKVLNDYNAETILVKSNKAVNFINFEAEFKVEITSKKRPDFKSSIKQIALIQRTIASEAFKTKFNQFLKLNSFKNNELLKFNFNKKTSIFSNLQELMRSLYVSEASKSSTETLKAFVYLSKLNQIPARFVSGYFHFKNNFNIHFWAECYVPEIGWTAFNVMHNSLLTTNHIKIAHGTSLSDCDPVKMVISSNETGIKTQQHSQQQ
ncbi:hypothetical protein PW52_15385 [Tamlana sedimentorum]|uniref:Transglutaminase-like domain-containing protein n=1 Tax=Neotamlana sedimentorum TaxID=1435349 RepID=A0A0D7W0V0_9FLAO|nr:transglutaminase-like domain-containing protein [Tamlana sedimentorum]KJD32740.1 hypothetical protein PW52_15385 [Tamlana sedimentorum]